MADEVREALDVDALVAHNAQLDVGVLQRHLDDWERPEIFDTLKLAKRLLPGRSSYRLGALVADLDLAEDLPCALKPHRAGYDVMVAARLFVRLASGDGEQPRSVEELRAREPGSAFRQVMWPHLPS